MKSLYFSLALLFVTLTASAQLDRTTPPKPGPAPKIQIDNAQQFVLKNGLRVFVVENHKIPAVTYSLSLDIDPVLEGDAVGYVSATGELLKAGTTTRTKDQIDEQVDFIGATLSTSPTSIYARSLKKHAPTLLSLMSDVLLNPVFPQEELDKFKKQMTTSIASSKDDPGAISENVSATLRYGKNHPYGEISTEKSIENITLEKCKNYYTTYFRPNVAYLVIVGDITLKEAKKQANQYFGKWTPKPVPTHEYKFPETYTQPKVVVANKEGANQSTIVVTHAIDIKPGHPDAIKASVMNQILGGGSFSSRLIANLREDKAYTYGAYSRLRTDEIVGNFNASSQVRGEITDSALSEVIKEMHRIRTELVDQADLDLFKNMMTGSFARSLENPQTIASFALNIEKYKLPKDYYQTYLEKLASVTVEDIREMAQKYILPENAIILAVGDAAKIRPLMKRLSKDGKVEVYDFYGNQVKETGIPSNVTAKSVIENYIKAIGGKELVEKVESINSQIEIKAGPMLININSVQAKPNKLCVETFMQGNLLSKQVFNGTDGKIASPAGEQKLEGKMLEKMKYESFLFAELMYQSEGFTTELTGVEEVNGEEAYKMVVTLPSGDSKTSYYSTTTGLKLKEVATTPQGSTSTLIKEYQTIDGVKMPLHVIQSMGPQSFNLEYKVVEINKAVDPAKFAI
jgi:predicted Zn-dependent peptidase